MAFECDMGRTQNIKIAKTGYHRYWGRSTAAWGYVNGPIPSIESLPRLRQLVVREALQYFDQWYADKKDITVEPATKDCDLRT